MYTTCVLTHVTWSGINRTIRIVLGGNMLNPNLPVNQQKVDEINIRNTACSETKKRCPKCDGVLYTNEYQDEFDGYTWCTVECEEIECNYEIDLKEEA